MHLQNGRRWLPAVRWPGCIRTGTVAAALGAAPLSSVAHWLTLPLGFYFFLYVHNYAMC
jgi:hypothetical protein